ASRTAARRASRSAKCRYAAFGTTPTIRVTSRSTTASGPPARARSTPAATSAGRTVPRGRGPRRRARPTLERWLADTARNYSGQRPQPEGIVDSVHILALTETLRHDGRP